MVFMYSGQGSQYFHMGYSLYKENKEFKRWMDKLDEHAQEYIGISLVSYMYDKNKSIGQPFDKLLYSSPAIFMIEYALTQVLIEKGIKPDYVIGTSLGEFTAAAVAGSIDTATAFKLIAKQSLIFENYCQEGLMIAVIHDSNLFTQENIINTNSELVSINYEDHFVISGKIERLMMISEFLKKKNISHQTLPVRYAFHSSLLDDAKNYCLYNLEKISFNEIQIPIISCVSGKEITTINGAYLWDVAREPIVFKKAFNLLESRYYPNTYIDLGPSGTLANFAKANMKADSRSKVYSIITPFTNSVNNLNELISSQKKAIKLSLKN